METGKSQSAIFLRRRSKHGVQDAQVWNNRYAFAHPALATKGCTGKVGMWFKYGGNGNYEKHRVGFWGEFIAYITTGSNSGSTHFGD